MHYLFIIYIAAVPQRPSVPVGGCANTLEDLPPKSLNAKQDATSECNEQ